MAGGHNETISAEPVEPSRVDLAIQFALAAAAQEEFPDNSLRPLHILKYVYLADLAYGESHGGETYTGVRWKFFHFGPWAAEVQERIETALEVIGAQRKEFQNRSGETSASYALYDRSWLETLDSKLPLKFTRPMLRAVRKFGARDDELLHHVYRTEPMLRATPGQFLSFAADGPRDEPSDEPKSEPTARQQKRQKAALADLRSRIRERAAAHSPARRVSVPPAALSEEVSAALEELWHDDEEQERVRGTLRFGAGVWDAQARTDDEVP